MNEHATRIQEVRSIVRKELAMLCGKVVDEIRETILIREGHYCGRRFQIEGFIAVWFLDKPDIKLFGADGDELKRVDSGQTQHITLPNSAAA